MGSGLGSRSGSGLGLGSGFGVGVRVKMRVGVVEKDSPRLLPSRCSELISPPWISRLVLVSKRLPVPSRFS